MINDVEFLDMVRDELGRDLLDPDNIAQFEAVTHEGDDVLILVAGPGSGKTTVLVLRALKAVLVQDVLPESMLITTFTKKAARELRTRWLDWGSTILDAVAINYDVSHIDLNRCRIDTIDSIAQQALTDNRLPGTVAPNVAEGSVSKLMFKKAGFATTYRTGKNKALLDTFYSRYTFDGSAPWTQAEALEIGKRLSERLIQDLVEVGRYQGQGTAQQLTVEMLSSYNDSQIQLNTFDFTSLQKAFLDRMQDGNMDDWLDEIQVLLIDEYQDTNPLQEAIYFEIINRTRARISIVGDDDQSMYRFRGGSVELFTNFAPRCYGATGRTSQRVDMVRNFRSTPEIISYYNRHIGTDPGFVVARVNPGKPDVQSSEADSGVPVLGMFRQDAQTLASSLAIWIDELLTNRRIVVGTGNEQSEITVAAEGNLGDMVLLSHSVEEVKYNRPYGGGQPTTEVRFAGSLRTELSQRGWSVFNPRGRALRLIPQVQILLGLVFLCIDPDATCFDEIFATGEAKYFVALWRAAATQFLGTNPDPSDAGGINAFVNGWQQSSSAQNVPAFPPDWPALELVFKLITWLPLFQSDPEHQVYLEAVTRIVSSIAVVSPYKMMLLQYKGNANQIPHVRQSRLSLVRDALIPIAEKEIDVDEDVMPSVPRNRLPVMTIHQSKGLEFPLVIVDVGSHFTMNHRTQRFLRYPDSESNVTRMEDDMEPYLQQNLRGGRTALDRTFDDLMRLYYVAFSRPQSVLMLVGNEKCLSYGSGPNQAGGIIPNIALGWHRDGSWPWRQGIVGRRPPVAVEPPFLLI